MLLEVRSWKYYKKGLKFYRPVAVIAGRRTRILRRSWRTAAGAMRYGQAVLERYQHWCDVASAKEMVVDKCLPDGL
ncbi:MAG: hypothetical protein IMZ61_11055 [Planctomycetes bacterium]|nr:hypothetical protein [Planctomycetota bacterium]